MTEELKKLIKELSRGGEAIILDNIHHEDKDYKAIEITYSDGIELYAIWNNGIIIKIYKTLPSLIKKVNELIDKYDLRIQEE